MAVGHPGSGQPKRRLRASLLGAAGRNRLDVLAGAGAAGGALLDRGESRGLDQRSARRVFGPPDHLPSNRQSRGHHAQIRLGRVRLIRPPSMAGACLRLRPLLGCIGLGRGGGRLAISARWDAAMSDSAAVLATNQTVRQRAHLTDRPVGPTENGST